MRNNELNRKYQSKWYKENKNKHFLRIKSHKDKKKLFIERVKRFSKCEKCGFDDFRALEFHHRNPEEKLIEIYMAAERGWALKRIKDEIRKCNILCSNCHQILHYEERKSRTSAGRLSEGVL